MVVMNLLFSCLTTVSCCLLVKSVSFVMLLRVNYSIKHSACCTSKQVSFRKFASLPFCSQYTHMKCTGMSVWIAGLQLRILTFFLTGLPCDRTRSCQCVRKSQCANMNPGLIQGLGKGGHLFKRETRKEDVQGVFMCQMKNSLKPKQIHEQRDNKIWAETPNRTHNTETCWNPARALMCWTKHLSLHSDLWCSSTTITIVHRGICQSLL